MPVAVCVNCGNLLAATGPCARCGQQAVPPAVAAEAVVELVCAKGFHYVGDDEDFCRCGHYTKSDKVGE